MIIVLSTQFSAGARAYTNAFFGPGIGPIYLDDFLCRGNEDRLIDCPNGGLNMIDFCNGHADDAGVRCAESKNGHCRSQLLSIFSFYCRLQQWRNKTSQWTVTERRSCGGLP